jgi:hypothetical protein
VCVFLFENKQITWCQTPSELLYLPAGWWMADCSVLLKGACFGVRIPAVVTTASETIEVLDKVRKLEMEDAEDHDVLKMIAALGKIPA